MIFIYVEVSGWNPAYTLYYVDEIQSIIYCIMLMKSSLYFVLSGWNPAYNILYYVDEIQPILCIMWMKSSL